MPARVPVEERLFSLVLALLATETGLTKNEILSTVQGYRQKYVSGGNNSNLERQFERDKDDIRDLGVPLDTVDTPGQPGDNHVVRYRIVRGNYELPADVTFSAEETTLLGLAAMVWREGSLSAESQRALVKLRSIGDVMTEPVLGYAPRARARDVAFEPLRTALDKEQVVRFAYLKPGETASRVRTVVPLALVQHEGRWHLSAMETDTGARRTFLLRRIVSAVHPTGTTIKAPDGDHSGEALLELAQVSARNRAIVEVAANSDADTRLAKRRGTIIGPDHSLELHYADENILADELAGFGPEVLVTSPSSLRTAVIERLKLVSSLHAESMDG